MINNSSVLSEVNDSWTVRTKRLTMMQQTKTEDATKEFNMYNKMKYGVQKTLGVNKLNPRGNNESLTLFT